MGMGFAILIPTHTLSLACSYPTTRAPCRDYVGGRHPDVGLGIVSFQADGIQIENLYGEQGPRLVPGAGREVREGSGGDDAICRGTITATRSRECRS